MNEPEIKILFPGRHISLVARGKWEFATRNTKRPAVGIVAVTNEDNVVLVEQRRPAVDATLIELPAGLSGDIVGAEQEALLEAAKRELLEETGYEATTWTELVSGYSSPGLTDEMIVLFLAEGLTKVSAGGGDASESIVVHEVPLGGVIGWLEERNCKADLKLLAGLYAAMVKRGQEDERGKKKRISKSLSYVLRHQPDSVGLELAEGGWVEVDTLIQAFNDAGKTLTLDLLQEVVRENDKQRFEFSDDQLRIRARQGHSVDIDLGYEPALPPDLLYHGTATRNLDSIFATGLNKGNRHHVHLSTNKQTMLQVAQRHGKPVVLAVDAGKMVSDGHQFFVTGNQVWLTEEVPPQYLSVAPD